MLRIVNFVVVLGFAICINTNSVLAQLTFFGFEHTPIGDAELMDGGDFLIVDGLGDSGNDGVSIALAKQIPNNHDFVITSPTLDVDSSPPIGAFVELVARGIVDNQSNQVVSRARYDIVAPGMVLAELDLSNVKPSSVTALIFANGVQTDVHTGLPSSVTASAGDCDDLTWDISVGFPAGVSVSLCGTFASGATFSDDKAVELFSLAAGDSYYQVFLQAEDHLPVEDYSRMDIFAGMMPALIITDEQVVPFPGTVLLGDVNLDGSVNLLDVAPFIDLLISGNFQAEADINGDGAVNLLDVAPFIDLLAGN